MKNTKTEFKFFTIPEWKQEEAYLQKQHENGWKFIGVNLPGFYHFMKCEPEAVVYQLDYRPDKEIQKDEYIKMFQDCGWEYIQDFVGYSYFRKAAELMDGEEEIFCDNDSRFEMMLRVLKGRMSILIAIFLTMIIPNIIIQMMGNRVENKIFLGVFLVCFGLYAVIFVKFGIQFWKAWKAAKK